MALFAVTLVDQTVDIVDGADAYQQEGPLTTFFAFDGGRHVIDSWSVRLASYRTADVCAIRRGADNAKEAQNLTSLQDAGLPDTVDEADAVLASA